MDKNGQDSCTESSRHMNIQHLFVKDRVYKLETEVQFFPPHLTIADYFKNPLQGKLFKLFCDLIMGYKHIWNILADIEFNANESVVNKNKVTENSNLKNSDKFSYAVVLTNSNKKWQYWKFIIWVQVPNIESILNLSPISQRGSKNNLISIDNSD